jgi:ribosome-associated toxin RatA of RatAB toxin-antitoxin module
MEALSAERSVAIDFEAAKRLFQDVDRYAEVVPGLREVRVTGRRKLRDGEEVSLRAFFATKSISGSFNARIVFANDGEQATAELIKGPFELLRCEVGLRKSGANTIVRASANYATPLEAINRLIEEKLELYLDLVRSRVEEHGRLERMAQQSA